jgi:N-acetylglucosamine-6-phosphate deacetylase
MTNQILIHNAHVFTPAGDWEPGWLLTEDRQIYALGPGYPPEFKPGRISRQIDASGRRLLPGLIDLHVHGAMGCETMDASPEGLRQMARYYARHGVTGFLATTWTASREQILAAIQAVADTSGEIPGGAALLGVHLEGPYLNPAKCGAQDTRQIRRAGRSEALEFLDAGPVRLLALAPEFPENLWLIDECVRRGIAVAAGHTTAGLAEMQIAVSRGVRQVTHCFNGMQGFGHRDLGTVGAAMALPEVRCELIADNIHVHPAAQKILVDVKGCDGVILITDAIRGTGMLDGEYAIDDRTVTIRDGQVRLPSGALAGSVLTLERGLEHALQNTGRSLQEAWRMSSLNAACAINLSARKGSLEAGKDADLVLLDDDFSVALTVVAGQIAYEKAREGV